MVVKKEKSISTNGKKQVVERLQQIAHILEDINRDRMSIEAMKMKIKLMNERSILTTTLYKMD